MAEGENSILIPKLEEKILYDRDEFYDVLQKLIDAKCFDQVRLRLCQGRNFTQWTEK